MARRSKSGVNKSQAIRDYITANPKAKPKDVVTALNEQGVVVTAAFVSTLRSNDKRKGRKGTGRRGRPAGSTKSSGKVGLDSLVQAKQLIDKMGGIGKAREALDALSKILGE